MEINNALPERLEVGHELHSHGVGSRHGVTDGAGFCGRLPVQANALNVLCVAPTGFLFPPAAGRHCYTQSLSFPSVQGADADPTEGLL